VSGLGALQRHMSIPQRQGSRAGDARWRSSSLERLYSDSGVLAREVRLGTWVDSRLPQWLRSKTRSVCVWMVSK
jgi:hypothetical protein